MTLRAQEIVKMALELGSEERAEIVSHLLSSLDAGQDHNAGAIWEQEIRRRVEAVDSAKANLIPWSEARERLRGGLGSK